MMDFDGMFSVRPEKIK